MDNKDLSTFVPLSFNLFLCVKGGEKEIVSVKWYQVSLLQVSELKTNFSQRHPWNDNWSKYHDSEFCQLFKLKELLCLQEDLRQCLEMYLVVKMGVS